MAKELVAALLTRDDWDRADLWGLADDRGWYELLTDAAASADLSVEEAPDHDGVAPFLALPGSWDAYLEGLGAKLRHEIKRKARKLEAEAGPYRIVTADPSTLIPMLDRFVELHRMSEGPKGVFLVPGMEIFFRRLGEAFADGTFRLTMIEVGGHLAAGTIGFVDDGTSFLYNSAFDRSWGALAPGMVLVGEDIRLAIDAGCTGFDLLKGDYAYKYRFGAVGRRVRRFIATR
jgi:CelD/BcsL family acetyltransferase involved in cellulose biosynthesis